MPTKKRPSYHHGDLRKALVDAGIALIEDAGIEALTLRGVAARAGVSHAAPAHHFRSLTALLTAIAGVAFSRLAARLGAARAGADPSPVEQVRAHGRAYLAFARGHPGLFRLMFTSSRLDWSDAALRQSARLAYAELEAVAGPVCDAVGAGSEAERADIEQLLWSVAHGYAHLAIEEMVPKKGHSRRSDVPDIARILLAAGPAQRRSGPRSAKRPISRSRAS